MAIDTLIDGKVASRLVIVRHLTGIPELAYGVRSFPHVTVHHVDSHGARSNRLKVEVYPRRMQFETMQPVQVGTPGVTRILPEAEAFGEVYAYALVLAREAQDLAEIWMDMVATSEQEILDKTMAAHFLSSAPHRFEAGGTHALGTQDT